MGMLDSRLSISITGKSYWHWHNDGCRYTILNVVYRKFRECAIRSMNTWILESWRVYERSGCWVDILGRVNGQCGILYLDIQLHCNETCIRMKIQPLSVYLQNGIIDGFSFFFHLFQRVYLRADQTNVNCLVVSKDQLEKRVVRVPISQPM